MSDTGLGKLTDIQYDTCLVRAALLSRNIPTTHVPGDVVYASLSGQEMAFRQLGSFGESFPGIAIARKLTILWPVLEAAGIAVPQWRSFLTTATKLATKFADEIGYPVAVYHPKSGERDRAEGPRDVAEVMEKVQRTGSNTVLIGSTRTGADLDILVHHGDALAAVQGGDKPVELSDVHENLLRLAISAVDAVPGISIASVQISLDQNSTDHADQNPLVERVRYSPSLRDFSGGALHEAMRLAQEIVDRTAASQGTTLATEDSRVDVEVEISDVVEPAKFAEEIENLALSIEGVTISESRMSKSKDGLLLRIVGPPIAVALIVTRAVTSLSSGEHAQLVATLPIRQ